MWLIIAIPVALFILYKVSRYEEKKYIENLGREQDLKESKEKAEREYKNSPFGLSMTRSDLTRQKEEIEAKIKSISDHLDKK